MGDRMGEGMGDEMGDRMGEGMGDEMGDGKRKRITQSFSKETKE